MNGIASRCQVEFKHCILLRHWSCVRAIEVVQSQAKRKWKTVLKPLPGPNPQEYVTPKFINSKNSVRKFLYGINEAR